MEMCRGKAPARAGGRSMHGGLKPQACAALASFDGYCPVHLAERGYTRCPTCGAWRRPGHTDLTPTGSRFVVTCDICDSMGGPAPSPALPLVGNLVEEGLAGLDREDENPPLDSRAIGDEALRRKD
jgi:hypothetical protein